MKTQFYNKLQTDMYNYSKELISDICIDLNREDDATSLIDKYLDKPPTLKKVGKIKDPNAPKRNKSAYMFFAESIRTKLRSKYPHDNMGDISKRGHGIERRNTKRENRLEELGRVDAEKGYSRKGKRNLRDEKKRIIKNLNKSRGGGVAKRGTGKA